MSKTEPNVWEIDMERLGDVDYAEDAVKSLFIHVKAKLGPFVTRGLFNLYAPSVTKREAQLSDNVTLYWKLLNMPVPNVNQLAKQLAEETGKDRDALKHKICRASKSKEVRECLKGILYEFGADEDFLDILEAKLS
jgi:hypothetical protein